MNAQQIELSVQTGHSSGVNSIAFSPGDVWLASAGSDNKIILWDFLTARQADVYIGHSMSVTDVEFHPTGKYLISSSLDSTIKIWDVSAGKCISSIKFSYPLFSVDCDASGSDIVVAGKEIVFVTLADLLKSNNAGFDKRTALPIRAKKYFSTVAFSCDDQYLAFGGEEEDLGYLIDLNKREVIKKIPAAFSDVFFEEDNSKLIYSTSLGLAAEISLSDRKKRGTSTDWMLNAFNAVTADSAFIYLANDRGEIVEIDRLTFAENRIFKTTKSRSNTLKISNSGHFIAGGGENGRIVLWDLSTGLAVKDFEGAVSQINDVLFSGDGKDILIGYQDGSLRKTNLFSNQSIVNSPQIKSEILNSRFQWSVFDIVSFEKDSAVITMHKKRYALDEENTFDKITEYTVVWIFKDNYLKLHEHKFLGEQAQHYMDDRKSGITNPVSFLLNKNSLECRSLDGSNRITSDRKEVVVHEGSLDKFKIQSMHSDILTSVSINEAYGFFATAGWDGLIRFYDINTSKLISTFGPFGNGQFIYINPDGYYFSSKKALDYVGFKWGEKFYSFEQFDLIYNRPDLVASYLPYFDDYYVSAYKKAYLKRLKKLELTEADLLIREDVPSISYTRNLGKLLTDGSIELIINCRDLTAELDRLHVRVNGVPEYGRYGKSISGHSFVDSLNVVLNPGTNYIQLYCTNKSGVSSLKESFTLEAHKRDIESDLYLISIGVSKYIEHQYNLNYAAKDAEDVVRFFDKPYGPFSTVHTKLLVDTSVTLSAVYELKNLLLQAKQNDVVVLFIAGHGVLDLNFDYYLATHDMDFKNPSEKGIPYDLFDELLDHTKSRKKVMFIDACHSGEIDKDDVIKSETIESEQGDIKFRSAGINIVNKEETNVLDLAKSLFADMRLNNGTTVISSAGGNEFAIESDNWKNGAFTYCFLYGLSSGDADLNKNKSITLSEIQEYLLFQVNKLTEGAQTPTSRVENLNNDFVIR